MKNAVSTSANGPRQWAGQTRSPFSHLKGSLLSRGEQRSHHTDWLDPTVDWLLVGEGERGTIRLPYKPTPSKVVSCLFWFRVNLDHHFQYLETRKSPTILSIQLCEGCVYAVNTKP